MQKTVISTPNAPAAIGPYSQGIDAGSLVFTSGQLPMDMATGELEKQDITRATQLVMKNIEAVLTAAGTNLDKIIKTTIYITDFADFAAMNAAYGEFFKGNPPARTTIQAAGLPLGVTIEIEAIAVK